MNRWEILNAVVLATGVAMGVVLGVVCVIYGFYVSSVPRLWPQLNALLALSAAFWGVAGSGGLALWAHRRNARWRWLAQPLALLPLAGIVGYLVAALGSPK